MPTPLINPNTSILASELAVRISAAIEANGPLYARPENAAVIPEALLTVLAATIACDYERHGHATLIALSTEKLADLVEEAYALREDFGTATKLAKELSAIQDADALAQNPPEAVKAQVARLMDQILSPSSKQ